MTVADLMRLLPDRLARWAPQFVAAELCYGVDAATMAAIVDRESLGGEALTPASPGGVGDHGRGHGLGQIDDRAHMSFVDARFDDGVSLWSDPTFNILYGARLLRRNLDILGGQYDAAVAAYNCGAGAVRKALKLLEAEPNPIARRSALDGLCTGKDYVTDVLTRREKFLANQGVDHA